VTPTRHGPVERHGHGGAHRLLRQTIPQLFGEEVVTLLPFLALMYALTSGSVSGARRDRGRVLVSSLLFASSTFRL